MHIQVIWYVANRSIAWHQNVHIHCTTSVINSVCCGIFYFFLYIWYIYIYHTGIYHSSLFNNNITSLPSGLFAGLSSLKQLWVLYFHYERGALSVGYVLGMAIIEVYVYDLFICLYDNVYAVSCTCSCRWCVYVSYYELARKASDDV